ncbi:hypothetical protein EN45_099800 [Penicillium chrysogenum]|jgi:hypothetical protein|uniref:Uncharacterized protein n=1 Tax=Penicillium chrysogenum TaxID=5076 RepID=A0A167RBG8_PENCH|nr:uncharacterized protein N7525_005671 [Penicillium rubens]KAJ5840483.1 hypothetical protein N7525_005671 [Penicillium rubens]KAJ5868461.1 hypothetical protein N7534_003014 [Penicillium rubens]KZN85784.1 hypothetical protein EN45_099800 [Penicillium chrysogenum]
MNTTPEQTLNIEYALVSEGNPHASMADYERCARLHNHLVAYGWMARDGQETLNLDELASQPSIFADEDTQAVRE